ncbi:leucine-rich repeat-containing protein 74B isoform X2 [Thalassophryne amazonica]|uniref:leucine-rich repeat-containing protein 74B isoform X2 n=1 Tax=Thalassophryne amazonica TaxID=390379 RepID=UPI001471FE86|nr:leucine-rich repeat-containing protein 74B isoform X2 [Thalassophryne amazonica]
MFEGKTTGCDDNETDHLPLREQTVSQTEPDVPGPKGQHSSWCRRTTINKGQDGQGQEECMMSDDEYDTDLELEEREDSQDSAGQRCYLEVCKKLQVVPSSYFLHNMQTTSVFMMHYSLGPQGTKALAVSLVTNTSILRLNLRDNWMEGMGGAAIAEMLKENCYITEVDLSDNMLEDYGAKAIASMLQKNATLVSLNLSGNHVTDRSTEHLGQALITNTTLQHLDLSHNALGECTGQNLRDCLSENMGLRSLSLAWNSIRGKGAVMLADGLRENIFLRTVDLSFNGFAKEGAVAMGLALKENDVLEELNLSNNRIPPEGAIHLALGLKVNKRIKSLNISRNPVQNAGCYGILQSVRDNPDSAMESLDFSDIAVNQDFEELYAAVKEKYPALTVNHGGTFDTFRKVKA